MIRKLNLNIGNSQSVFSIVEKERVQTMKIGIMGGTFEPIHIGHLLLGEFAYEDFGLDEIWFYRMEILHTKRHSIQKKQCITGSRWFVLQ